MGSPFAHSKCYLFVVVNVELELVIAKSNLVLIDWNLHVRM